MRVVRTFVASALVACIALSASMQAQVVTSPEVWHAFAEKLEPGKTLKVRLKHGQRFKATLLQVSPDAITLQPKTRAAAPPQRVAFEHIETLEVDHNRGIGVGKAVAIGAGVAAGAWLALMAFAFAVWGD